jgi:hypothetical protein
MEQIHVAERVGFDDEIHNELAYGLGEALNLSPQFSIWSQGQCL